MRSYEFDPAPHERAIVRIVEALVSEGPVDDRRLYRLFTRHPKAPGQVFSKHELIRGVRRFAPEYGWDEASVVSLLRSKPVRSHSGVAPVTVLTKPYPCPGKCVFCPNDVRMPKSYLAMEPGAQRAFHFRFDPYAQTYGRLRAFHENGHAIEKVELIVLGGTWTHYPESYRIWFISRCFQALNDFDPRNLKTDLDLPDIDYEALPEKVDGRDDTVSYNQRIGAFWRSVTPAAEHATWEELRAIQDTNRDARARCVGLSLETRPDEIDESSIVALRRLGATKLQLGLQSLDDEILKLNERGHDVLQSARAVATARAAGFKIQAHWMANLLGATPDRDKADFERLFDDDRFRPDELKLYPNALVESSALMLHHERGAWRPYDDEELLAVVTHGLLSTPRYCRLSRVIRDIPGHDILVGNKQSNFRETAERVLRERGAILKDIRAREVKRAAPFLDRSTSKVTTYGSGIGTEVFLEFVDDRDRLAGFCRLALADGRRSQPAFAELRDVALIRELHVYGPAATLGDKSPTLHQHGGLGRRLLDSAEDIARRAGYRSMAVISAVGTERYYERSGYTRGDAYHHKALS
ncbi:MAG: tRNA uridine(34) 5-carboxymethylaminomethyl modification radical SAM/GNAT enzyme Elp3 [Myxococcales bacterium]|nr:tRNA uridine(34) 5-carboxymethylaminomethyl modification radical SAM/GNAT enzyme Elp3 [Myxococcales bacterium]